MYSIVATNTNPNDNLNRRRIPGPKSRTASDEVIMPPRVRSRRQSKYYTRPVFKEPKKKQETTEDVIETFNHATASRSKRTNRSTIVNQLRDEPLHQPWDETGELDAIQPSSRTQYRIKTIIGNQSESIGSGKSRHDRGLEGRLLKQKPVPAEYFDSSASVATCSNLDGLEAKCLSRRQDYKLERQPSDISSIRREVSRMIGEDVTPIPPANPPEPNSGNDVRDEESNRSSRQTDRQTDRQTNETYVSNASKGIMNIFSDIPYMQTIITDMAKWKFP